MTERKQFFGESWMQALRCTMRWTREHQNHSPTILEMSKVLKVQTPEAQRRFYRLRDYGFVRIDVGNRIVILYDDQRRKWDRNGTPGEEKNASE